MLATHRCTILTRLHRRDIDAPSLPPDEKASKRSADMTPSEKTHPVPVDGDTIRTLALKDSRKMPNAITPIPSRRSNVNHSAERHASGF